MIQDILPHRLRNEYHPDVQPQDNDRVLCFREGKLLLREGHAPAGKPGLFLHQLLAG